jgi:hypothetical protein
VSAYDEHIARYRMRKLLMWCVNDECPNYQDGVNVVYEEENGQGAISPEDCPLCGHPLVESAGGEA